MKYLAYYGFKSEPFSIDVSEKNLLKLPNMLALKERLDYITNVGGVMVVTGDVGTGKSTSLRWASSFYHTSSHLILNVIATSGPLIELYRQLCWALNLEFMGASKALALKQAKAVLTDLVVTRKQKVVLIVDEASLLRHVVFEELHTLTQFEQDSKNRLSLVLAGQVNLLEKLAYRSAAPIASRVISKAHLAQIEQKEMNNYLRHHLEIAGVKTMLFSEQACVAIQQGSGGLLRKANHLAKGGLLAAAIADQQQVTADHIRLAATELI